MFNLWLENWLGVKMRNREVLKSWNYCKKSICHDKVNATLEFHVGARFCVYVLVRKYVRTICTTSAYVNVECGAAMRHAEERTCFWNVEILKFSNSILFQCITLIELVKNQFKILISSSILMIFYIILKFC